MSAHRGGAVGLARLLRHPAAGGMPQRCLRAGGDRAHGSVYADRLTRDSVYVRDSVWVSQWASGDTVFITKAATRYAYRDRLRTDTVAVVREHREKVPVEVERQLTWWQQARLKAFWWLVAVVAALCLIVAWLARRL